MFYKQQTKQIKHTLYAKEIIQSNQISPSISEARAYLPDQSLALVVPRTHAPLALQAHAALVPPRQSSRRASRRPSHAPARSRPPACVAPRTRAELHTPTTASPRCLAPPRHSLHRPCAPSAASLRLHARTHATPSAARSRHHM
jgi:hypothetical protein